MNTLKLRLTNLMMVLIAIAMFTAITDVQAQYQCFELQYPVTYTIMPDSISMTVKSQDDFNAQMTEWYKENPNSRAIPVMQFPVTIVYEDGTEKEIANQREIQQAMRDCFDDDDDYDKGREPCFEFGYPLTVKMPDGTTLTGDSEEDFSKKMNEWYENNPDKRNYQPEFVYPIIIVYEDGTEKKITNEKELMAALADCFDYDDDDSDWKRGWGHIPYKNIPCFELDFPVTYIMPDTTEITVDTEGELVEKLTEWWHAQTDYDGGEVTLKYPVTIVYDDGTEVVIANKQEMDEAVSDCEFEMKFRWYGYKYPCFEVEFPATYKMPDGTNIAADSGDELEKAVAEWYKANPKYLNRNHEMPVLVFPATIVYEDGTTKDLSNQDELEETWRDCWDKDDDRDWEKDWSKGLHFRTPCFELEYPLTYIMPDSIGTRITGNDIEEIVEAVIEWRENNKDVRGQASLEYPITIVYEDGTSKEINNEEEMRAAVKDCEDEMDDDWDDHKYPCFEFLYPVTYIMPDGSTIIVESERDGNEKRMEWYKNNPNKRGIVELQYPVTIIYEDGTEKVINNENELRQAFIDCDGDNGDPREDKLCFTIDYPLTIVMPDGTTITGNSEEDLARKLDKWLRSNPVHSLGSIEIVYPITIRYEDGTTKLINNDEEYIQAYKDCNDEDGDDDDSDIGVAEDGSIIILSVKETKDIINNAHAYPNPAANSITIRFNGLSNETGNLVVLNSSGDLVLEQTVNCINGENNVLLSTSHLASGKYYVRIIANNDMIMVPITIVR